MYTNRTQLVETLRIQLNTRIDRAIHALLVLYDRQTGDEQRHGYVIHRNGVGFMPQHADILCGFAKQYVSKGSLSPKQQKVLLRIMPKYASQLIKRSLALGFIRKVDGAYVWEHRTVTYKVTQTYEVTKSQTN